MEGLDGEFTDRQHNRDFDDSLQAVASIRDWANTAIRKEGYRKTSREARPRHQADDALNALIARLVEISDYGPKTSEPSYFERRRGKVEPDGPLIRYLELCLKPLGGHDPAVAKLTRNALRSRVRRSTIRTKK